MNHRRKSAGWDHVIVLTIYFFPCKLPALKRSKRRVQAVISTELPFLISKEFLSNQENNPFGTKNYAMGTVLSPADAHKAKWSALFDQMDKALSEEEQQLVSIYI